MSNQVSTLCHLHPAVLSRQVLRPRLRLRSLGYKGELSVDLYPVPNTRRKFDRTRGRLRLRYRTVAALSSLPTTNTGDRGRVNPSIGIHGACSDSPHFPEDWKYGDVSQVWEGSPLTSLGEPRRHRLSCETEVLSVRFKKEDDSLV